MLNGERVTLRPIREDDLPALYEWRIDMDTWALTQEVAPYPLTWERFLAKARASSEEERVEFAIEADGTLVGRVGLFHFDPLARSFEVGIAFGPGHRGKGYGREVLALIVDFAFRHHNAHRVHLSCLATNEPAQRAYRAAGFVEEGRKRQSAFVDGEYVDEILMSRLVTD